MGKIVNLSKLLVFATVLSMLLLFYWRETLQSQSLFYVRSAQDVTLSPLWLTLTVQMQATQRATSNTIIDPVPSNQRVALVVPYRNREDQLGAFVSRILPFVERQGVDLKMFLVEQDSSGKFNRAKLFNVGYNESFKYGSFDCFIFHDVDLIPENETNIYQCEDQPKHMSVAVDTLGYRLPYATLVGGVLAMNKSVFQHVNGFSNVYFGWGGEDDDMAVRISKHGYKIIRPSVTVGRYKMIRHQKEQPSPSRMQLLSEANKRLTTDGLNSLNYTLVFSNLTQKYVHILVKL